MASTIDTTPHDSDMKSDKKSWITIRNIAYSQSMERLLGHLCKSKVTKSSLFDHKSHKRQTFVYIQKESRSKCADAVKIVLYSVFKTFGLLANSKC